MDMLRFNKSQAATEFLLITGFFLLIIIPSVFYFYSYTQSAATDVEISKADSIGRAIVDTAESVFYYGKFSKQTLTVQMPQGITSLNITMSPTLPTSSTPPKEYGLVLTIFGREMYFPSKVPLKGAYNADANLMKYASWQYSAGKWTLIPRSKSYCNYCSSTNPFYSSYCRYCQYAVFGPQLFNQGKHEVMLEAKQDPYTKSDYIEVKII